jgi:hypothetical protein
MWILTNEYLRRTIISQLPEVPPNQVLSEPMQRNTAPAIGLAAHILRSLDPDAVMGVFPSDHVVGKPAVYRAVLNAALKTAAAGKLVVVGIQPRWPETGYGYIEFPRGTRPVSTRSPSWPTPGATWPPATSTGTPACSFGAPTCCSTSSAATFPEPHPCWLPYPVSGPAVSPPR